MYVYIYIYVHMYMHMYIYIYTYVYMYTLIYLAFICLAVSVVCFLYDMYVYMYMCVFIYKYTYVYLLLLEALSKSAAFEVGRAPSLMEPNHPTLRLLVCSGSWTGTRSRLRIDRIACHPRLMISTDTSKSPNKALIWP